ncbi:MAG: DUF4153 domain-containing protein [Euzebya sp.]
MSSATIPSLDPQHGLTGPPPPHQTVRQPTRTATITVVALTAMVGAIAAGGPLAGLGATVILLSVLLAVGVAGHSPWWTASLLAATAVPALLLSLRSAPELTVLAYGAVTGQLIIAGTTVSGARPWTLGPVGLLLRMTEAMSHTVFGPDLLRSRGRSRGGRTRWRGNRGLAVLRGLLLAVPLIGVVGWLLSADLVFADVIRIDLPPDLWGRVAAAAGVAWLTTAVLRGMGTTPLPLPVPARRWLGITEAITVLALLVGVFALFAATQAYAAAGGASHILAQAGLTYAEYAREGFFQMIAVAVITLGALTGINVAVRMRPDGTTAPAVRWLSLLATLLVMVIVGVALRRLDLYSQAFGLTRLRLWAALGTVWVGGIFVLLALRMTGLGRRVSWLLPAVCGWALIAVVGVMLLSPDAVIARANIALDSAGVRPLDVQYAVGLSSDAVPDLLMAAADGRLSGGAAWAVLDRLCTTPDQPQGWAAYNRGRARAEVTRREVCQQS